MFKGLFRNLTTVKRSALSLKADKTGPSAAAGAASGGSQQKVVGGLREVKVASAEVRPSALLVPFGQCRVSCGKRVDRKSRHLGLQEAHAVLARGQSNRRVFSTLANRASSRSHGIFTIKLVRASASSGAEVSTSRFSIVDLAGSERVVNTQTTGERLKEAGNINKSLMVLGQCMEVLRKNQERDKGRKVSWEAAAADRLVDCPRGGQNADAQRALYGSQPAIVPFRHSKLTEMFQSFFTGDGKAVRSLLSPLSCTLAPLLNNTTTPNSSWQVMIVNINPYETGFDENSHVMKFSAVAKSVMTLRRGPDNVVVAPGPGPAAEAIAPVEEEEGKDSKAKKKEPRVVRVSLVDGGEEEEVLYEGASSLAALGRACPGAWSSALERPNCLCSGTSD